MIEHLRGRHEPLAAFGWSGPEAEWVALVCLHSGLFTRAQFCAYFDAHRSTAGRFVSDLVSRRLAVEEELEGLPTTARVVRIYGRNIYRKLGIENVRHRRRATPEIMWRRLLSLDYVLEQPQFGWLPTEQEKVASLEELGLDRRIFPLRRYAGKAAGQRRYFALKLPVALDPQAARFVYVDPGHATAKGLVSWGSAHALLWRALREAGRLVAIVSVARDATRAARAARVLRRWTRDREDGGYKPLSAQEEAEVEAIRQAVYQGDTRTLERWGGLRAAMRRTQALQTQPAEDAGDVAGRPRIDHAETWQSERLRGEDPAEGDA